MNEISQYKTLLDRITSWVKLDIGPECNSVTHQSVHLD